MTSKNPDNQKILQALANWLTTTRERVPLLDDSADSLLNQLELFSHFDLRYRALEQQPRTIGLYGHSQPAKASLISMLSNSEPGHIPVAPAGKHLNYLSHINPLHASTRLAIRFSSQPALPHHDWPLMLRLFSEAELVQIFIRHSLQLGLQPASEALLQQRMQQLYPLRQPRVNPAISQAEVAALLHECSCIPRHSLQASGWQQLIHLLPQLNLNERAEIYPLFWGEQRELSQHWLTLAETLQALGNSREIAIPLNLIVDNFSLPVEGLLNGELVSQQILVCPLDNNHLLPAVSVAVDLLAFLAVEITIPLAKGTLFPAVDLLDIPGENSDISLAQTKITFLPDYYRQHQQPDLMLICNAAADIRDTTAIARRLLHWQQETRPAINPSHPGLIWVITPYDQRFKNGYNPDENIQRLLGKPGELWGTLQALENRNLQRMNEWLAQAINPQQRKLRHSALITHLLNSVNQCFLPLTTPAKPADSQTMAQQAIRELQQQAIHHGDLLEALLPDARLLKTLCQADSSHATTSPAALFRQDIDLFTSKDEMQTASNPVASQLANQVYRYWINHVRQWTQQAQHARQLELTPDTLRWLGNTLIITSYRLNLSQKLHAASKSSAQAGAQLRAQISNFLSWLGYADTPLNQRPASRINKGLVIFQPAGQQSLRLTRVAEQPVHAATHYVYDWLIALYTRAEENTGYRHPLDLKPADRANLKKWLNKIAAEES